MSFNRQRDLIHVSIGRYSLVLNTASTKFMREANQCLVHWDESNSLICALAAATHLKTFKKVLID